MKKYLLLIMFLIRIITNAQTSIPAGTVSGIWTVSGSPYNVMGNIYVPSGSTLVIQPGATVIFQGTYKFLVLGQLLAIGTVSDSITFTASNITNGWQGLRFDNTPSTSDTSKFMYTKLLYGKTTSSSSAINGGAFYFDNFSKAIISNCRISKGASNGTGGGIYCRSSNLIISENIISNNTSSGDRGGGIYCENGMPTISNNTITNNTAGSGGGISCNSSNPIISHNTITKNTGKGGGINCNNSNPIIFKNTISNNTGSNLGGGISCESSNPIISNNTIINNTSSYGGGGISVESCAPIISNTTIANNTALAGGALFCNGSSEPGLRNCILWGNTASSGSQVFLQDEPSDPNFYYCDVQGDIAAFDLNSNFYFGTYTNNINSNPMFVAPSGGSGTGFNGVPADWSLQVTSPCIDTGDNIYSTYPATDKAGNPRVTNGRIDIGAYEYQGIPITTNIVQSNSTWSIGIFPNPAQEELNIFFSQPQSGKLEVFDMVGKLVYEQEIKNQQNIILQIKSLTRGMYFVKLNTHQKSFIKN